MEILGFGFDTPGEDIYEASRDIIKTALVTGLWAKGSPLHAGDVRDIGFALMAADPDEGTIWVSGYNMSSITV